MIDNDIKVQNYPPWPAVEISDTLTHASLSINTSLRPNNLYIKILWMDCIEIYVHLIFCGFHLSQITFL